MRKVGSRTRVEHRKPFGGFFVSRPGAAFCRAGKEVGAVRAVRQPAQPEQGLDWSPCCLLPRPGPSGTGYRDTADQTGPGSPASPLACVRAIRVDTRECGHEAFVPVWAVPVCARAQRSARLRARACVYVCRCEYAHAVCIGARVRACLCFGLGSPGAL